MFVLNDALVTSASDLTLASKCEFAFLRQLDLKLGRVDGVPADDDPMKKRAGALGDEHELRVLQRYRDEFGAGVVEIDRPRPLTHDTLRDAAAATADAFARGAQVVFQATFFDETTPSNPFIGFADFIVRRPDGTYRVQDTKLARSVKVTALLQLAAYHEQLTLLGVPADEIVELILGDESRTEHHVDEILPVFRNRRARLAALVTEHLGETAPVAWGDERYAIDGNCEHCSAEVEAHRDLLLVAGIRVAQRAKLLDVGIRTLDDLAARPEKPVECAIADTTYAQLQAQAALQASAAPTVDAHAAPPLDFYNPAAIADLPAPSPGDIYFDFEGDPLYREGESREALWGIDYLFGLVDDSETFTAFWAHDLAQEKQALFDFLAEVKRRRERHPGMHIYHYASYERTHLLSIAARHGVGEHEVDDLLRDNVLVDLYPLVKKTLRIGGRSYSIKKLEPLYMGSEHRAEDGVTNAAASVDEYAKYQDAIASGERDAATRILGDIADYNEYDCVSTRRLRNWLLEEAAKRGVFPGAHTPDDVPLEPFEPSRLNIELLELAERATENDDRDAAAGYDLAAAAIDYHRREDKSFWWEHFSRLTDPIDDWSDTRGVFFVADVEVVADWGMAGAQRSPRRQLRLTGDWAPGSGTPKGDAFLLYDAPAPFTKLGRRAGARLDIQVSIETDEHGDVLVTEVCPQGETPWEETPSAVTPGPPPRARSLVIAIEEWGNDVVARPERWPNNPAADILRRTPPRTRSGEVLEPMISPDDGVRAVVSSLLDLDRSYLAVQGPPGTGKTYLAAHVITDLVQHHGWKIGVVAQSHKVVENVLSGIVRAGLDRRLVGKVLSSGEHPESVRFTPLPKDGHARFARAHPDGYVVGGTAWDFTNLKRVERDQLDLLVIDEAGQFSLAATIAVGVSTHNLLLLGDPQQLPQVSQGTHPAPVDQSALGYIAADHPVLPAELGYFLAESRRMHPEVTAPVSRLAYDGALRSHASTRGRMLRGTDPGLRAIPVDHRDNATLSVEEARVVVGLVRDHLGTLWTNPDERRSDDPLTEHDVIVVSPYNAQVETIREYLDAAGLHDVRVGTVDKFQGQEAVISIVSLAASSAADVPRGLSFLLSRNRLNVAISRAQWAAYLVYSPALVDYLPISAEGIAELSRFLDLVN